MTFTQVYLWVSYLCMYSHFSHTEYYVFLNLMLFLYYWNRCFKVHFKHNVHVYSLVVTDNSDVHVGLWLTVSAVYHFSSSHSCHIECSFQLQTVLVCFISLRSLFKDNCIRQDARLRWLKMHFNWNVLSFVIADFTHLFYTFAMLYGQLYQTLSVLFLLLSCILIWVTLSRLLSYTSDVCVWGWPELRF